MQLGGPKEIIRIHISERGDQEKHIRERGEKMVHRRKKAEKLWTAPPSCHQIPRCLCDGEFYVPTGLDHNT